MKLNKTPICISMALRVTSQPPNVLGTDNIRQILHSVLTMTPSNSRLDMPPKQKFPWRFIFMQIKLQLISYFYINFELCKRIFF